MIITTTTTTTTITITTIVIIILITLLNAYLLGNLRLTQTVGFSSVRGRKFILSPRLLLLLLYSRLFVVRRRSFVKSTYQQEIKAIYPSTYRLLCAVFISV
jgi:hypothetical protein